jgi:hypothetical protein
LSLCCFFSKRTYLSDKNSCDVYFSIFIFYAHVLVSDKFVLVSIEKCNPTEYGTFYVPFSAYECAIFNRICHTCVTHSNRICHTRAIFGPWHTVRCTRRITLLLLFLPFVCIFFSKKKNNILLFSCLKFYFENLIF